MGLGDHESPQRRLKEKQKKVLSASRSCCLGRGEMRKCTCEGMSSNLCYNKMKALNYASVFPILDSFSLSSHLSVNICQDPSLAIFIASQHFKILILENCMQFLPLSSKVRLPFSVHLTLLLFPVFPYFLVLVAYYCITRHSKHGGLKTIMYYYLSQSCEMTRFNLAVLSWCICNCSQMVGGVGVIQRFHWVRQLR